MYKLITVVYYNNNNNKRLYLALSYSYTFVHKKEEKKKKKKRSYLVDKSCRSKSFFKYSKKRGEFYVSVQLLYRISAL